MKGWVHILVGLVLLGVLVFGGKLIYELNTDARELEFTSEQAQRGQAISTDEGCIACHTLDGSPGIGPTWLGMIGRTELLTTGNTIIVDKDYFKESISHPASQLVDGYPNVMLRSFLEDDEIDALFAFAQQLSSK